MTAIGENGATSGAGVLATFAYDDAGRRTSLTRGNGTTTSYCYGGVTTQPGCGSTGTGFYFTGLAQDLTGTASDQNQTFTYNPASQIMSQLRSNDAYAFKQIYNANRNYTANGLNQYTAAGNAPPSYDAKGNLTGFWGQSYGYSSENLLTTGSGTSGLAYDPALRLYQVNGAAATVRFGYDGTNMIGEYNTSNALQRRYVHGPGANEPLVWYEGAGTSDRRWLHADERGSVTAISDGSGNPIAINSYDEYGMPATGNIGRFGYTGQAWLSETGSPPNGLSYYKARMYSPRLGRFMQTDPIGIDGGLNLYAYVRNDPVNATDPLGLQEVVPTFEVRAPTPSTPSGGSGRPSNIATPIPGVSEETREQAANRADRRAGVNDDDIVVIARRKLAKALDNFAESYLMPPLGRQEGESFSDCVQRIAGDGGLAVSGATAVASGANILPYPRAVPPGGSGTSIISTISRGFFRGLPRMSSRIAGTTSVGGAIGRILCRGSVLGGAAAIGLAGGKAAGAAKVCSR